MKLSPLLISSLVFSALGIFAGYEFSRTAQSTYGTESVQKAERTVDEQETIDVYRKANEAVVFITTVSFTFDMFSGATPEKGTGSGVIVDAKKGIILTNLHVLSNAKRVEVSLANGGVHPARLLGIEPDLDIAVLGLIDPPAGLTAVPFGDSSSLEVGQGVIAIGNPFGLDRTLTAGIVSSLNRSIKRDGENVMRGLIQTDASINVGNSGGPLLDKAGNLIGINTAILSRSGDSAGIGFAVPINQVKRILPELIATGRVLKPEIGWVLVDTNQGPMVHQVLSSSPAEEAGVQPILRRLDDSFISGYVKDFTRADIITAVNGTEVSTKEEVENIIGQSSSAREIQFTLKQGNRDSESRNIKIKPNLR
jgi:S1-C subfamily serine protease